MRMALLHKYNFFARYRLIYLAFSCEDKVLATKRNKITNKLMIVKFRVKLTGV